MNQPEPNDEKDMPIIDIEGLIFGDDYLGDPDFLALPSETREAWIDADKNGRLTRVKDYFQVHHSIKQRDLDRQQQWSSFIKQLDDRAKDFYNSSQANEEFLKELYETQFREIEESNKHTTEELALGSLSPQHTDRLVKNSQRDLEHEGIKIKISIRVEKKNDNNGKPLGTQTLQVPHVDKTKIDTLRDFYLIYGNIQCIYKFDSGKQIKVFAKDKKEGIRVINRLLKVVIPKYLKCKAEKHCTFTEVSEKAKTGIKGSLKCVHIVDGVGEEKLYEFQNRVKPPKP